jgi:hypothetical protein
MIKIPVNADMIYVTGDSWVHGSELIDPTRPDITNHFDKVHEDYRIKYFWPKQLADKYRLPVVDGSYPGASNDRILRTTVQDIALLRKQGRNPFVIVCWSQLHRFELPQQNEIWRPFVSPSESGLPKCVLDLWKDWSTDRSDLIKWLQQLILFDAFLKQNNITYFGTTVFKESYWQLEKYIKTADFEAYSYQLSNVVDLTKHMYNFSLEGILLQKSDILYGPGGHPLLKGHTVIANYIKEQLDSKFYFKKT